MYILLVYYRYTYTYIYIYRERKKEREMYICILVKDLFDDLAERRSKPTPYEVPDAGNHPSTSYAATCE